MFDEYEEGLLVNRRLTLPFWFQRGLIVRSPTIIGTILIVISFIFLPWIRFVPTEYLDNAWLQVLGDFAPGILAQWLEWTGRSEVSRILNHLLGIGSIPAWVLFVFFVNSSFWVWGAFLAVACTGVLGIITLGLSFLRPTCCLRALTNWLQAGFALLTAIWLLTQMPTIDALGNGTDLGFRLLLTLAGARLGEGIWLAWLGLILLVPGGLMMQLHPADTVSDSEYRDLYD